jgi:hypothetical protein
VDFVIKDREGLSVTTWGSCGAKRHSIAREKFWFLYDWATINNSLIPLAIFGKAVKGGGRE